MSFPQYQDNRTQSDESIILKETCFTIVFIIGILFGKLITPELLLAENKDASIPMGDEAFNIPKPWDASQATGAPNTFRYGDHETAWASGRASNQEEWLELKYTPAVKDARMVLVFQTYNPGALIKMSATAPLILTGPSSMTLKNRRGTAMSRKYKITNVDLPNAVQWISVPKPSSRELEVKSIPLHVDYPVGTIKLTIASKMVRGYNEIDAVGIVDAQGKFHWAKTAKASSSYANRKKAPSNIIRTTPNPTRYSAPPPQDNVTSEDFQKLTEAIEKLSQEVKQLKKRE